MKISLKVDEFFLWIINFNYWKYFARFSNDRRLPTISHRSRFHKAAMFYGRFGNQFLRPHYSLKLWHNFFSRFFEIKLLRKAFIPGSNWRAIISHLLRMTKFCKISWPINSSGSRKMTKSYRSIGAFKLDISSSQLWSLLSYLK